MDIRYSKTLLRMLELTHIWMKESYEYNNGIKKKTLGHGLNIG